MHPLFASLFAWLIAANLRPQDLSFGHELAQISNASASARQTRPPRVAQLLRIHCHVASLLAWLIAAALLSQDLSCAHVLATTTNALASA